VDICESLLWNWRHKGYLRLATGNLLANFERLKASCIGPFDLEAVMLRVERTSDLELLLPSLQAVVNGGLLAIHAAQPELLKAAMEIYDSLPPDAHVMRGHSGRTAFMFVDRKDGRDPEGRISPDVRSRLLRVPKRTTVRIHAGALRWRLRKFHILP
jgi:hypothetical protein